MDEGLPAEDKELMEGALDNLAAAVEAAKAGAVDIDTVDQVYDGTMRTIAEVAFGGCDYPRVCKFYGDNPSFCDRSCDIPVWDQI